MVEREHVVDRHVRLESSVSGETEANVSAWTIDSLHSHLKELMNERDRRYEQRFAAQEKAVATANQANEKRLDSVNEFRAQMADLQATFMPRVEAEQRIGQVDQKIDASVKVRSDQVSTINSRLDLMAGKSTGSNAFVGYIVAAAAVGASIAAVISVIIR